MSEDNANTLKVIFSLLVGFIIIHSILFGMTMSVRSKIEDPVICIADIQSVREHMVVGGAPIALPLGMRYDVGYTYCVDDVVYSGEVTLHNSVMVGDTMNIIYSEKYPYRSKVIY